MAHHVEEKDRRDITFEGGTRRRNRAKIYGRGMNRRYLSQRITSGAVSRQHIDGSRSAY